MHTTIRSITKSCKTCQINKKRSLKYGHLPSKIVLSIHWEALCVDLIGPYTLKGKDGSSIDFMALTMIDPTSCWLEVVELPTITRVTTKKVSGKERTIEEEIFDKSSDRISRLTATATCSQKHQIFIVGGWCYYTEEGADNNGK
jgi:hypothetical protein